MKLSSKEMTILAVFLSIAILVAAAFLFVLPEYESIEPNKNALQAAKDEKAQIYASLERENTIDQEIQDAIDLANKISLYFYEDLTPYDADVIVREILEATNMSTNSLSLGSYTSSTLTVTDYVETIVSYPLKEYAGYDPGILYSEDYSIEYDENGKLVIPEDYVRKYGEEQALTEFLTAKLSTQSQTIGAITVTFSVSGTRGNFLNFLNYIADLERATLINSTSVSYTGSASNAGSNPPAPSIPAEGEEGEGGEEAAAPAPAANTNTNTNTASTEQQLTDSSEITAAISMTLYCITPMQAQETTTAAAEPEPAE